MKAPFWSLFCAIVVLQIAEPMQPATHPRFTEQEKNEVQKVDRTIKLEIVVDASVEKVWRAWTTQEGIRSFFAPDCDIDLRVLGKYDILFAPTAPPGLRGAEGNLILAIQEGKMLSFTWDAPPAIPDIRKQRTSVVIRFAQLEPNKTKVSLTQSGWGEGAEWNKAYYYFIQAWGDVVLPFLKYSLEVGPIDWKNPPRQLEKAKLLAGNYSGASQ
ncbi:MAG TPA: SRPBCC domain-containing protein [Pyrinomonadaceae bacterium]|nr:SRPBCC domain-containing protein [Pyrinomonadaceae bacterium]